MDQSFMLGQRKQGRSERIALLEAFSLHYVMHGPLVVKPGVGGLCPIECFDVRQERRGAFVDFGQNGCAGDGVICAAAVQAHDRGSRVGVGAVSEYGGQRVGAGAGLEGELERPGGQVELGGKVARQDSGGQPAEGFSSSDPADTTPRFCEGS